MLHFLQTLLTFYLGMASWNNFARTRYVYTTLPRSFYLLDLVVALVAFGLAWAVT